MTRRPRTATEAASIIAMHARAQAHKSGKTIDLTMCQEIVSEYRAGHAGGWLRGVAAKANPKTVLRLARSEA